MNGSSLGLSFGSRGAGSSPARDKNLTEGALVIEYLSASVFSFYEGAMLVRRFTPHVRYKRTRKALIKALFSRSS